MPDGAPLPHPAPAIAPGAPALSVVVTCYDTAPWIAAALQSVLEGRKMPAAECLDCGMANKVVPADELDAAARDWADRLAQTAPLALAASKRLLRSVGSMSFGDAITAEGLEQTPLIKSNDFKEGVAAFFQKRKPEWTGT